jgi:DNA-binding protein HU-beta
LGEFQNLLILKKGKRTMRPLKNEKSSAKKPTTRGGIKKLGPKKVEVDEPVEAVREDKVEPKVEGVTIEKKEKIKPKLKQDKPKISLSMGDAVSVMAIEAGISKSQSKQALQAFVKLVGNTMASGGRITISGLGVFKSVNVAARKCYNPITAGIIDLPATRKPKILPSRSLKALVK